MNDTISRQAAIDVIFNEPLYESGMKKRDADAVVPAIYEKIKALPPAQPEIIRCKDCKWYDREHEDSPTGYCHACKHAYFSSSWEIGIYRKHKPDFFCADGERRKE